MRPHVLLFLAPLGLASLPAAGAGASTDDGRPTWASIQAEALAAFAERKPRLAELIEGTDPDKRDIWASNCPGFGIDLNIMVLRPKEEQRWLAVLGCDLAARGAEDPLTAGSMGWLADDYQGVGEAERAAVLYRQAIAVLAAHPDTDPARLDAYRENLARAEADVPPPFPGQPAFDRVLAEAHRAFRTEHPRLAARVAQAADRSLLAHRCPLVPLSNEHAREANRQRTRAVLGCAVATRGRADLRPNLLAFVADGYRFVGDHAAAEALYRQVVVAREAEPETSPETLARARSDHAEALWMVGRNDDAVAVQHQVHDAVLALHGPGHPAVDDARDDLRTYLHWAGQEVALRELLAGIAAEAEAAHAAATDDERAATAEAASFALVELAEVHRMLGELAEADEVLDRARPLLEEDGVDEYNREVWEYTMAGLRLDQGRYAEADAALRDALFPPVSPDISLLARIRQGRLYFATGRLKEAAATLRPTTVELIDQGELVWAAEGVSLMARVQAAADAGDAARTTLEQGLERIEAEVGATHHAVASMRVQLADVRHSLGESDAATAMLREEARLARETVGPTHPRVATIETHLARIALDNGDAETAETHVAQALAIALTGDQADVRWQALTTASDVAHARERTELAVLFGKQAVSEIEAVRKQLERAAPEVREAFTARYRDTYRVLADRLLALDRLPEAESVLRLLKAEEYRQFVRSSDAAESGARLTAAEATGAEGLAQLKARIVADAQALRALQDKAQRTPEEDAEIQRLWAAIDTVGADFDAALDEIAASLDAAGGDGDATLGDAGLDRAEGLQQLLADLDQPTVLLQTVVAPDTLHLLVTTPDVQLAERVDVDRATLNGHVRDLREALRSPRGNPLPHAQALYDLLLRPVEPHLDAAGATRIMYGLDGNLRYVPMAALHDGEQWVAERWQGTMYSPAGDRNLGRTFTGEGRIVGLGVSEAAEVAGTSLSPLPGVVEELDEIVAIDESDEGILPGEVHLDGAFTADQLRTVLGSGTPWVHVASHFVFDPTSSAASFLLLGGGGALSLDDLSGRSFRLQQVDLLTLSACETAMGAHGADGRELEGLSALAQRKGAAAVLATLWPVSDASSARWMAEMYRLRAAGQGKAAAVQQVQQAFITGEVDGTSGSTSRSARLGPAGKEEGPLPAEVQGWKHPFYWAPYVLMGDGG